MKKLNKFIFAVVLNNLLFSGSIYATTPTACNTALAKELAEISERQEKLLDEYSKNSLKDLNARLTSLQSEKVAMLSLQKLQREFNKSKDAIKKLENGQFLSNDAVELLSDLDRHVNNIAAHQSLRKTLDEMNTPNGQGIFMDFIKERRANGDKANEFWGRNFYSYMKNCSAAGKPHCVNFLNNIHKYKNAKNSDEESKFKIIDEDQIESIIDNYGDLLYYITEGEGADSPKYQQALARHKRILNDEKLIYQQVSLFDSKTTDATITTLINLYNETTSDSKSVHDQITPELIISKNFLNFKDMTLIKNAKGLIESRCTAINVKCEKVIEDEPEFKRLPEVLRQIASEISKKTNKEYNLENIYSQNAEDSKIKKLQLLSEIFKNNNIKGHDIQSKQFRENCLPLQNYAQVLDSTLDTIRNAPDLQNKFDNCLEALNKDNLLKDKANSLPVIESKIAETENLIKNILKKDGFKELEILKAALFDQYYNQCENNKSEDNDQTPKCGLTLFDHTKTVDTLNFTIEGISKDYEIRNYLKYLGFSDDHDRFSDPSYWGKILRNQCGNYSEKAAKELGEEEASNKEICGFESTCNACSTIARLGKEAVIRQESARYVNLPMHQYREYDKATKRMVVKRHPISSIVANTLKYAASGQVLGSITNSLIGTQKLRGNLWSLEQNALYTKQSIAWTNQYKTQMYNQLDLRNPNLFGNYLSSPMMGMPIK